MDFVGGIFVDMSGYSMRKTEENMRNLENKKTNTSHYNNNCNDDYTFISPRAISNNCYCEFYEKSVSINNECIRCPAARITLYGIKCLSEDTLKNRNIKL